MKALVLFISIALFSRRGAPLLVIDMDGKKPLRPATEFSTQRYFARDFPIYADDLPAVIDATEKAARLVERKPGCGHVDTLKANRTVVIVQAFCAETKSVSVRLITRIAEQSFLCDFEVVRKEQDGRKAQRKLLDFADYLSQ